MCAEHPVMVLSVPAGRFVPGITMNTPHFVSYTVIHGCVLSFQAIHLQIQVALGIVSGDRESALHGVWAVCNATTITNLSNPLHPLPWRLADPIHVVITEGESGGCTGASQGPPKWHQVSSRLYQLHLTLDTCKDRESLSGNCHISMLFFSLMSSHTLCIFFFLNHLLKKQQGKPISTPTPW
jgi:hypothetical protein